MKLLMAAGLVLFTLSCKKETVMETQATENDQAYTDQELINKLAGTLKVDASEIVLKDDVFYVHGDVMVSKSDVVSEMSTGNQLKHQRHTYIVNATKVKDVKVYIDPSVPAVWKDWVRFAIDTWNDAPCSIIGMREVFTLAEADTRVEHYYENTNTIARAYLPNSSGSPGFMVEVNTKYNSLSDSRGKEALVHEFGHVLGLRHTNSNDGQHIFGTQQNGDYGTSNSVMYSSNHPWYGFTWGDRQAFQYLYPSDEGAKIVLKTNNGHYVQAPNGGGSSANASADNGFYWETFILIPNSLYGGHPYYVIQAGSGHYLQAVNGGGGSVVANSANRWAWETFELVDSPLYPGKYVLKTKTTGHYLQAANGGGSGLVANSTNPWAWETFEIINSIY